MNIYFAGSIRGGRQDAALYQEIITSLQKYGTVLTEHIGNGSLTEQGEPLAHATIHDRDFAWLLQSDVIVAEVTTPSLGVGYEIGRAVEQGKHVLCLFRPSSGKQVSAMIGGCANLTLQEYETSIEAGKIIDAYFSQLSKKKVYTLTFVLRGDEVLLGQKKRGFGMGLWNGFGGKVGAGETIEFAARRELEEEAGIGSTHLFKHGVITFIFPDNPVHLEVHIFSTRTFSGQPVESDEARPQWWKVSEVPYDNMWPDDKIWLEWLAAGKRFGGECYLQDSKTIAKHTIKEL